MDSMITAMAIQTGIAMGIGFIGLLIAVGVKYILRVFNQYSINKTGH